VTEIALPDAPAFAGLRFRRYRGEEDHPAMLRVYMSVHEHDGLEEVLTLEKFNLNYATLVNCDPARDIVIAEIDGEVVAYARVFWNALVEGGRSYENFGFVHPLWRRRGIGGSLHRHTEGRLRQIADSHGEIAPKWFGSEGIDTDAGNTALLLGDGYTAARFFYDMVAPSLEDVVAPPMPDGIELRPVTRDQYRTIWLGSAEAFRDHWGEQEWTDGDWTRFDADPDNADPRLWRIGWDGDEVAGAVVTTVPVEENELYERPRSTWRRSACDGRGDGEGWRGRCWQAPWSVPARRASRRRAWASTRTARPGRQPSTSPSASRPRRRSPPTASRCDGSERHRARGPAQPR